MDYLSIMHDLEKKLERMKELIENQDYGNSLVELINETNNLVIRQNDLIRDKSKKIYCLNELLINIMYRARYKFRANEVQVLEDYTETQGEHIKINKSSLIRIFDNLINNSLYWRMGQDDKIKVSTKKTNRFIEVVFEDNGSGFKGDLEYLKEPFVTKKPGNEGLGLGLFIVGELMKNQNGKFEISNNSSIKEGSAQVRLIFPREDKDDN
ncbi:MAG: HAMP domain-containing histidine kinase [Finegoldia magna]|nr:HAMP domain-containing sensor histidine kinase [Finegoldia magna]MBS5965812.1 HAMP domain-containing histidine kinase [Finegoldia magna]